MEVGQAIEAVTGTRRLGCAVPFQTRSSYTATGMTIRLPLRSGSYTSTARLLSQCAFSRFLESHSIGAPWARAIEALRFGNRDSAETRLAGGKGRSRNGGQHTICANAKDRNVSRTRI